MKDRPAKRQEEETLINAAVDDGKVNGGPAALADVDQVMNWVRKTGAIVVPVGAAFEEFRVDNKVKTRAELLAMANRARHRAGKDVWTDEHIFWGRALPDKGVGQWARRNAQH